MATRRALGSLTLYSGDRSEVYGELADATWTEEHDEKGTNHILSGVAGDGTYEAFLILNANGLEHLAFDFVTDGGVYRGTAILLRPESDGSPGGGRIHIEADREPRLIPSDRSQ